MPVLFTIMGFFRKLFQKRENANELSETISGEEETVEESAKEVELRSAAFELGKSLIPAGHNMESYLAVLQKRWSRLIDGKAREQLIIDVNLLTRDFLRSTLKTQRNFKPSHETLSEIAFNAVNKNKALSSLTGRESLLLYLELYMIKLPENRKVK